MKYNCNWVYSIFPTRVEFQATDRETGEILFDETYELTEHGGKVLNSIDWNNPSFQDTYFIEKMVGNKEVKIFKYETVVHRNAINFIGKGTYNAEV